jgi:hypothetical protein
MNEPKVQVIEKLLQYNVQTTVISGPSQIPTVEFCNGFSIKNTGNSVVVIMDDQLAAGESKSFGGNRGEIYIGRIDLKFIAAAVPVIPRIDGCVITEKFYVNIPRNANVNNPNL